MRFAVNEITFVHVFRCDNDSTSSPSDPPSSSNPSILGSFHDLTSHSDDNKQLQLDNESKATNSIPHPIDSPSPSGSATADDTDCELYLFSFIFVQFRLLTSKLH